MERNPKYVVLIGDVGQGKSTIVEKLTGLTGLRSTKNFSATKVATPFYSQDQSLLICDTPGTNPIKDKLDHNMNIAYALNTYPVSLILIVVKADSGRIDNVIDAVAKYVENFSSLAENLGVCVTHMDKVEWSPEMFKEYCNEEFGIEEVVFTGIETTGEQLTRDIQGICIDEKILNITCENFLQYFDVSKSNIKIIRSVNREVRNFEVMKNDFEASLSSFFEEEQVNLVFEFQAWMTKQIMQAQKRVSEGNNFRTIDGLDIENEAGHIANLTNQLRLVLHDIQVQTKEYQKQYKNIDKRMCPHCSHVWTNNEGFQGQKTCGEHNPNNPDGECNDMATFSFFWLDGKLTITKRHTVSLSNLSDGHKREGCGNFIFWEEMAPVPPSVSSVVVEDIRGIIQAGMEHKGTFNFGFAFSLFGVAFISLALLLYLGEDVKSWGLNRFFGNNIFLKK